MITNTMWKVPTNDILSRFATMPHNLVVIGEKRITVAYARHEIDIYTTGDASSNYKWYNLLEFLEETMKRHCTIGAKIKVFHHHDGYVGQVRKIKKQNAFFQPMGVAGMIPGVELPANWELMPSQ